MFCLSCGQKNPDHAAYCMTCGRSAKGASKAAASGAGAPWMNTLGVTGLFAVGILGVYFHPMLEVAAVAYIAVAASTVWVFMDSPKWNMPRWPWTLGTLALWFLVFPVYLLKTRKWQGFLLGVVMSLLVVGTNALPNFYSAGKHFRRGVIFAGQQRLSKAEEEFGLAIKKDNTLGEARLNLGILYMSQGLLDAAEREFVQAKDLISRNKPKHLPNMTQNQALSLCLSHLAAVYAMRTSEAIQVLDRIEAKQYYAKAKEYADDAVKLDGDNVRSAELIRRLKQLESFLE